MGAQPRTEIGNSFICFREHAGLKVKHVPQVVKPVIVDNARSRCSNCGFDLVRVDRQRIVSGAPHHDRRQARHIPVYGRDPGQRWKQRPGRDGWGRWECDELLCHAQAKAHQINGEGGGT